MSEGLDEATEAFRDTINPDSSTGKAPAPREAKPERMFSDPGGLIEDDDAPAPPRKAKAAEAYPGPDDEDEEEGEEEEETEEGDTPDPAPEGEVDKGDDDEGDEDDPEYEVLVDGETATVKLTEALQGYIRTETFHRRLAKLNEAAEALHAEGVKIVGDRQRYVDMIQDMETQLKELIPAQPDWDKLYAEDAAGARKLQTQYEAFDKKLKELGEKKEKALNEAKEATAAATEKYAKAEFSKFIQNNKIQNKEELQKELASMRKTAINVGFSEEEVATVYDSRMLAILRKASKYDRMMAARPKPVQVNGKKTMTPGAKNAATRTAPKGVDRAQRRLAQTGSIHDAADVFRKLL